jgi:hypothetical protein
MSAIFLLFAPAPAHTPSHLPARAHSSHAPALGGAHTLRAPLCARALARTPARRRAHTRPGARLRTLERTPARERLHRCARTHTRTGARLRAIRGRARPRARTPSRACRADGQGTAPPRWSATRVRERESFLGERDFFHFPRPGGKKGRGVQKTPGAAVAAARHRRGRRQGVTS